MPELMWVEYIGPRYPGGIVDDFEHTKFYFGPENNYKCEIPSVLFGMIMAEKGPDLYRPCANPSVPETNVKGLLKIIKELEEKIKKLEDELAKQKPAPKRRKK